MMKIAAFAAVVAVASAACPGQCSGHGRCGEYDKCICNRQVGTQNPYRFAFTGPDCSLRTCPVGKAYDAISTDASDVSTPVFKAASGASSMPLLRVGYNAKARSDAFKNMNRDQKFVVKVMAVDVEAGALNSGTFTWKWEEDEYFGAESNIEDSLSAETARNLNKGNADSGIFVWFDKNNMGNDGWTNTDDNGDEVDLIAAGDVYTFSLSSNNKLDFDEADANTAHQEVECSGRGVCDYTNGKCKCADGYTGEACQRTACPNQCSGHGQCYSEARFVSDAGGKDKSYGDYTTAYDAQQQYGCKCDAGYRGPDCSQIECPSGADILGGDGGKDGQDCSARGLCDYSTGICKCFKGYYGERCESQTNFA